MQREGEFRFFTKITSKPSHGVRRHTYSIGAHKVIISRSVNIFVPNLAYNLHKWLDYTYKKNSMCKTFMIGAMKPVSLLFDQPTYMLGIWRSQNL